MPEPLIPTAPVLTPTVAPTPSAFLAANSGATSQVYGAQNIAQTTTAPAAAPNYADPFGLYNTYMQSPDLVAAQQATKNAQANLLAETQAAREQQTALGQNLQSLNRIRGAQGEASSLSTNRIAALNESYVLAMSNSDALKSAATDRYNIAVSERESLKKLITDTGGKAGISYSDSYETALAKATKYNETVAEDKKKDDEKQALKDMYFQLTGKQAKSMSTSELKKKVSKAGASAKDIENQLASVQLAAAKASLAKSNAGSGNTYYKIDAAFNQAGGNWDKTVATLSKTMDVGPGSVVDNELRRRNGLAPIDNSKVTSTDLTSQINQKISQIEDWNTADEEQKRTFIRSLGGDPSKFGL